MRIEDTKAFGQMTDIAQTIVNKSASKRQISEAVVIVKNVGYDKWKSITNLPPMWHNIVKELTE